MSIGYKIRVGIWRREYRRKCGRRKNILPQVAKKEGCNIFAKPDTSREGRQAPTKTECLFRAPVADNKQGLK